MFFGFGVSYFYSNNMFGDLYFQIAFLIVGIASFILSWGWEEDRMAMLHEMFEDMVKN